MPEFDEFFRTWSAPVWNHLLRLLGDRERADDCFQRVFMKAHAHFRDCRAPVDRRGWIFTIALNEARDERRRRKRDPLRPMDLPDVRTSGDPDPSQAAADRELAREVLRGVGELPDHQREIFLLVRYRGFSFAEAASLCGVSLSAAKMAVSRAHEKVLRALAGRIDLGSLR